MTRKIYHYLFIELIPKRFESIILGMSQDGNLAIDFAYNMQELIAADTPEAQRTALDNLIMTASALANLATEADIDLSDPERREIFMAVKGTFITRFLLNVPTMSTSAISNFIDSHCHFVQEFDELDNRELVHRQRALARA